MIKRTGLRLKHGALLLLLAPALSAYGWSARADGGTTVQPAAAQGDETVAPGDSQDADSGVQPTLVSDLFGPSDEEKAAAAAAAQREQAQDASIANLTQRVESQEDSIRRLTGEIEVLNHRLEELGQRIDRMKAEFNYKLCSLSAQQLGATAGQGDPNAIPCSGTGADAAAAGQPPSQPAPAGAAEPPPPSVPPAAAPGPAPGPGVLGTLPPSALNNLPQPQPAEPAQQTASADPHAQYGAAMDLLARQDYDGARSAFRSFADAFPKDPLAAQALYWLGDIAYVQRDYPSAAHAFAEELKKFPGSPRGAESMLRLGQSLLAMNQKAEGCAALYALKGKYPTASQAVLSQDEAVRKAGGCRR